MCRQLLTEGQPGQSDLNGRRARDVCVAVHRAVCVCVSLHRADSVGTGVIENICHIGRYLIMLESNGSANCLWLQNRGGRGYHVYR